MQLNTLKSISRLFAIVADKDVQTANDLYISVFIAFLNTVVDDKYVEILKEDFVSKLSDTSTGNNLKKLSLNSVKLISLLEELKSKLSKTDQILVLVYLILLIEKTGKTDLSIAFIIEVAHSFSVKKQILNNFNDFINKNYNQANIDIKRENIFCPGSGVLLFRVDNQGYKLNGVELNPQSICVLTKESVLSDALGKNYFFSEIEAIYKSKNKDQRILLSIRDLEYKKKNHILIHQMSLDVENAQMIAVIGNSGSGKTSFLRCISGHANDFSGIINYDKNVNSKTEIAYVPQENSFVPGLSVKEHLIERCRFLQFDTDTTENKCEEVLDLTGLKSVINNKVCKTDFSAYEISGGQQKRLAIATELLLSPDVIILDEPTSGLSSEDSYEIVSKLKKMSLEGKLVFASIHQPDFDLFMMFDKVLIFADGGFPVYFGSPAKAAEYFREINGRVDKSSDFVFSKKPSVILNLLSNAKNFEWSENISAKALYEKFLVESPKNEVGKSESLNVKKPTKSFRLFLYFLRFGFFVDFRHKTRFFIMLFVPLISGIALSAVCRYSPGDEYVYFYNPNLPVWILILLTTSVFIGLASSGHEFIYLRKFYYSLHSVSDNKFSHAFAVIVKYFLLTGIQSLLLVLPAIYIIGGQFHFLSVFLYSFALCLWGSLAGLVLSCMMKTTMTVYLFIPLIIIPQLVFSGALINFKNFNKIIETKSDIPRVAEIVPMRWAAEGLLLEFYTNNPYSAKIYQNRCELYNAVYYADFFLPEIISVFKQDSTTAVLILKNEESKNGFTENGNYNIDIVESLVLSYNLIKSECLNVEDSIVLSQWQPNDLKYKYSNLAIENIIDSYHTGKAIKVRGSNYSRLYKSAYKLAQNALNDYSYFSSYRTFSNSVFKTSNLNLIIVFMLSILNTCLLFIIVSCKSMRKA